jgi:hypothetical protein
VRWVGFLNSEECISRTPAHGRGRRFNNADLRGSIHFVVRKVVIEFRGNLRGPDLRNQREMYFSHCVTTRTNAAQ